MMESSARHGAGSALSGLGGGIHAALDAKPQPLLLGEINELLSSLHDRLMHSGQQIENSLNRAGVPIVPSDLKATALAVANDDQLSKIREKLNLLHGAAAWIENLSNSLSQLA